MRKIKICFLLSLLFSVSYSGQNLPLRGICAHRGASSTHPENTKASILEAVKLGVQMIEFDVRLTKDNKLIVIHSKSVDKTTNGKGNVSELTLAEILKLDAGFWKDDKFQGEKIPTFEEILEIIPDSIWMNIHIKESVETAQAVAKLLTERSQIQNAFLAVENKSAEIVRSINNEIKICCMERGNSTTEYLENAIRINADFIQLTEREFPVLKQVIPILKENNIMINFYYADSFEKIKVLFEEGVDFVLSNEVSSLVKEASEANLF